MAWELIASGTRNDIASLPDYESQIAEGQRGRVDFTFLTSVPSFQIDALRNSLEFAGVTDVQVAGSGDTIHIYYRKDPWWLPVIIALVLTLAIVLILWQLFKDVPVSVKSVVLIAAAAGGAALIISALISSARRARI